jgi:alkanesulfonate monooxygenase SsuD/methylene tetrahydromethanopterin reductase-like flavin-dependent oxidoreductase (luciferase family)
MRLGITLPYTAPLTRGATTALVRAADELGYATLRVAEHNGWDPFPVLAHLAGLTSRIGLGTGVAGVFGRSPAQLAQAAVTVDALSGGRLVLGLGTSGPGFVRDWHGVEYRHPLRRLRETVRVVRQLLRREALDGLTLGVRPARTAVPIHLGTLTRAGLELTGEIADGWLATFFSPAHFDQVLRPHLERGAARAGRRLADLAICVSQPVYVTDDVAAGRDAARPSLALFIGAMGSREVNFYNRLWRAYGFEAEAARIQELYLAGHHEAAVEAVTDEMVDLVTIVGTLPECRRRLAELERAGVDEASLLLVLPDDDPAETLQALEALTTFGRTG